MRTGMSDAIDERRLELLSKALDELRSALALLDEVGAVPAQIGAHVDLAIHELFLTVARMTAGPDIQIDRNGGSH